MVYGKEQKNRGTSALIFSSVANLDWTYPEFLLTNC